MATEALAAEIKAGGFVWSDHVRLTNYLGGASTSITSVSSAAVSRSRGLAGTIAAVSDFRHGVFYAVGPIHSYSRFTAAMTIPEEALSDTELGYFLGVYGGGVYEFSDTYKGDAGSSILAYWQSKNLDFNDQVPGIADLNKAIERVRLWFVDTNETDVTVSVSTDDGLNWTDVTKTLGTGTNDPSEYNFDFWQTGQYFRFKITNASASDNFQWVRMEVVGVPQGETYTVSS